MMAFLLVHCCLMLRWLCLIGFWRPITALSLCLLPALCAGAGKQGLAAVTNLCSCEAFCMASCLLGMRACELGAHLSWHANSCSC